GKVAGEGLKRPPVVPGAAIGGVGEGVERLAGVGSPAVDPPLEHGHLFGLERLLWWHLPRGDLLVEKARLGVLRRECGARVASCEGRVVGSQVKASRFPLAMALQAVGEE